MGGKLEENIEKGLVVTIPYTVETNGPMIVVNHSKKETLQITGLLYGIGVIAGIVLELLAVI